MPGLNNTTREQKGGGTTDRTAHVAEVVRALTQRYSKYLTLFWLDLTIGAG